jgi:N-acyl-D-amino-acid deacylase
MQAGETPAATNPARRINTDHSVALAQSGPGYFCAPRGMAWWAGTDTWSGGIPQQDGAAAMLDLIISGGEVLDGMGTPAVQADVGIAGGRIVALGNLGKEPAAHRIDAGGRTVAPGFIDAHSHDDFNLPVNPLVPGKILQGVTTQITGNCGWSPAPILPRRKKDFVENAGFVDSALAWNWESMADFLRVLPPLAQNIGQLVGHVTVRTAVMGVEDRPPTPEELEQMRQLVARSMEEGAIGFSTGLVYPPSAYAATDEIVALAKVAARYGGGYHTHMRDEGQKIWESIAEAAEIGRRSGARVQISHLKLSGKQYWGQADRLLAHIESFHNQGLAISADQYPYPAGSSGLKSLLPNWAHRGGTAGLLQRLRTPAERDQIRAEMLEGMSERGFMKIAAWTDVMICDSPSNPRNNGFSLQEIGDRDGRRPIDAMLDMLLADTAKTLSLFFTIGVEDMLKILRHPNVSIGSDGIITTQPHLPDLTKPHPRYYGTFPRVLGKYVRDEPVLSLPEAVRKMTSLPAFTMGLTERGRLAPGYAADVAIFDPATIVDTATYRDPQQSPKGIDTVLVNGVAVVQGGQPTGATPGQIIRRW